MGTVVVVSYLSLDGVMQSPGMPEEDSSGAFQFGGWQVPYMDENLVGIVSEWFTRTDAFLLGRKTYNIFATFWPHVTDPDDAIAANLNALPKHVVSTTLRAAEWNNTTIIDGDIEDEVAALRQRYTGEIQIYGSGQLIQSLRKYDLIDEYRIWTYPVVLGEGKRLFAEGVTPGALALVDSTATSVGATVNTYRPAGKVTTGSTALNTGT